MNQKEKQERIAGLVKIHGEDILSSPGMQKERHYFQHGGVDCYTHSVSVACMSVWLIHSLGIRADLRSTVRGALLHDYFLYDWHVPDESHRWHGFIHGRIAAQNARRDFAIPERERDIIENHMFPLTLRMPRYRESLIVNLADKICAAGEFMHLHAFSGAGLELGATPRRCLRERIIRNLHLGFLPLKRP